MQNSQQLTAVQEAKLWDLVRRLRVVALQPGVRTVVWDAIFDIEAKLGGGKPHFQEEPEQTIDLAERLLRRSDLQRRPSRDGAAAYTKTAP